MKTAPAPRRRTLGSLALALGFAALLAALSLVVWRQSRALESLRGLETVRKERALAEAERFELSRRIQYLESRGRIEPYARERLGLHVPTGSKEMVLLRIDPAPAEAAGGGL
ncbi:MAG: hypothetical protein ABFS34_12515 [Gemmatimonadota bacterium]